MITMKKILFLTLFSGFLLLFVACEDDYKKPNGEGNGTNPTVKLDPELFGKWSFGDPNDVNDYLFLHFKSDGTLIQRAHGVDYHWLWCIEEGQLKMYVTNGIPTYAIYRIEGNLLYFWSDDIEDWGLPLTKEE